MRFEESFLDDIRNRVRISEVVGEHVIWDKKKSQPARGDFWACCPFHSEKGPSFHADDRRGHYKCFGCGVSGDHFRFLTEKVGYTFPQAVEKLAGIAGLTMPEKVRDESPAQRAAREARLEEDRQQMAVRRAELEREREAEREDRIQTANELWESGRGIRDSLGDRYFQERGIPPVAKWPWQPHEAIRFHPSIPYTLDKSLGSFPAILARVQDAWGETIAVWRIYLDRQRPIKAPVPNAKVGLGPAGGGAVRVGGDGNGKIGGGEGLETSLAAWFLVRCRYPVWAMLSTSGVTSFEPPIHVTHINQFPDGDLGKIHEGNVLDPAGITAARNLRDRILPTGIGFSIDEMCIHGDALDLLKTLRQHEELQLDP